MSALKLSRIEHSMSTGEFTGEEIVFADSSEGTAKDKLVNYVTKARVKLYFGDNWKIYPRFEVSKVQLH